MWLNGDIDLYEISNRTVLDLEKTQALDVLLFAHCSGASLEKALTVIAIFDCVVPRSDRIRFILTHQIDFFATYRGDICDEV